MPASPPSQDHEGNPAPGSCACTTPGPRSAPGFPIDAGRHATGRRPG